MKKKGLEEMKNTRNQLENKVELIFQINRTKTKMTEKGRGKTRLGGSGCLTFNSECFSKLRKDRRLRKNNIRTLPSIRGHESLDSRESGQNTHENEYKRPTSRHTILTHKSTMVREAARSFQRQKKQITENNI